MRLYCCLCQRPMQRATVFIGEYPVGPRCAQRAGLERLAAKGRSPIITLGPAAARRQRQRVEELQMDLAFEGEGAHA